MIFDLTDFDIERNLQIRHKNFIEWTIAGSIPWAKISLVKKEIERSRGETT